jgi:FkbM family methyltransferase
MKFFKKSMVLCCLSNICMIGNYANESANDFVKVEKRNVVHKFVKMGGGWVDDFTATLFKTWEEDTFDIFEMVADKNGVAIDIGAWIGTTSIWLSKNFSHVIAVEADKESIIFLNKNLKASECTNVTVCNKALTDTNGIVFFGPRSSISDSLNFSTSYVKNEQSSKNDFAVPSITLDQFMKQYINENNGIRDRKITFIKCDIEGGEESILKDVLNYANINNCRVWMSFHYTWWKNKKITDFKSELANFYAICPKGDVCEYIQNNPFASVLLIPKRF